MSGPRPGRREARPPSPSGWRRDRIWQVGFVLGSALGAAIALAGRRAERSARRGLVDWPEAESIAIARLRRAPGSVATRELRAAEPAYSAALARVVPSLEVALGAPLPGIVERLGVVDRASWVRTNVATFERLLGRLEGELLDQIVPSGSGFTKASMAIANRFVTTRQVGFLLGFMAQRVLGQYDIALLTAESTPGRLLFVEENVRQTARNMGVPLDDFRTWIVLHETTHAFEFEAHPWLRPYLAERLERQIAALSVDLRVFGREAMRAIGRAVRGEGEGHWMERLMGDEQRRLFRETQAVMSLLEGFSDFIMDDVGRELVPGVTQIRARFHQRRAHRTSLERAVMRLTGLDLKLEQYRRGEAFVSAIASRVGRVALRRLWDGPESLPREDEIEDPDRWIARVLGEAGAA